jgi:AcrR family transcriptional regulator
MDALLLRGSDGRRRISQMTVPERPDLLAGEDLPAEPRQARSLDKRARLKKAGLALFGEKGYERTSIEDIAARANLAVGGFYLHFRSKRQLLLVLMQELLEKLSQLDLRPKGAGAIRAGLRGFLSRAFATDLEFLGAYRAWREAALSDPELARKAQDIQTWTTARVTLAFTLLAQLPGARTHVDVAALARVMDSFFWNLLAQAVLLPEVELNQWIEAATHLIYHALFRDSS